MNFFFSLDTKEFKEMIKAIRNTEKLLGVINYTAKETTRQFSRSLYTSKDIKKGEKV